MNTETTRSFICLSRLVMTQQQHTLERKRSLFGRKTWDCPSYLETSRLCKLETNKSLNKEYMNARRNLDLMKRKLQYSDDSKIDVSYERLPSNALRKPMKWHALDEDNTRSGYNSSHQIVTLQQKHDKVTEILTQPGSPITFTSN